MSNLICKLTSPELQQRKATVISELKNLVKGKLELHNGFCYQFSFSDSTLDKLVTFVKSERLCCDFFSFGIHVQDETLTLEITGSAEAKAFLINEIGF
jgi:hypothetical protein